MRAQPLWTQLQRTTQVWQRMPVLMFAGYDWQPAKLSAGVRVQRGLSDG